MTTTSYSVGTVLSDGDTPTFELVRIKMQAGQDVKPGTLIRIPVVRDGISSILIGRVRSAYEHNPNESPENINVRQTLGLKAVYPQEEDSTIIYRLVEADLVEQITDGNMGAPEVLPNSGAEVFIADENEVVQTLGLAKDKEQGLYLGETLSGTKTPILLKREAIQRHMFICGTTGSGKSYAMGVITEELVQQGIPVVFIDTQDEYSALVQKLGGTVVEPGKDFTIRISSLTESELLNLLPDSMRQSSLQCDIVTRAFSELQAELKGEEIVKFTLSDLIDKIPEVAEELVARQGDVQRVTYSTITRTKTLEKHKVFGRGVEKAHWPTMMLPCLAIKCKHLTTIQLQSVATAVLRELQTFRLLGHIPPYVMVIDEAHLFVPEGSGSACKQIIAEGVRIGRHHGICMVLLTQSPVDIDKSAIRQCNTRLVFALEPDQLDAIRGVKADASEEMLRALPKMPRGVCLLSGTYESVKHTIPVAIRRRNTPDAEGGKAPDIFGEMKEDWPAKIEKYKRQIAAKQGEADNGASS